MKKFAILIAMVAMLGSVVSPLWASDRPAADELINGFYESQGEAVPQVRYNYLYDLITNDNINGWGSIFVYTNYNAYLRIRVLGALVPRGANPGDEIRFEQWLNPYEVVYVNLANMGMGNGNAWALLWSEMSDFGSGVLIYCTNASHPGIAWEKGWYWINP